MTLDEIKDYKQMCTWSHWFHKIFLGKRNEISLFGYTSCSLDKSTAFSFVWEDQLTRHFKVLFHIKYKKNYQAYFVDTGAYDSENEVVLFDGVHLKVDSVKEVKDLKGNVMYTLITLSN